MRRTCEAPSTDNIFELLLTDLIMCGADGDTNAAVAGALLGCFVGYTRLPSHWANGIANREWLILSRVARISESVRLMEEEEEDADTAPDGGRGLLDHAQLEQRDRDLIWRILQKQQARREAAEKEKKGS